MLATNWSCHHVHKVTLENIAEILRNSLINCFKSVDVRVTDCPNLDMPPFGLSCPGLAGKSYICDVGSMSHLLPIMDESKQYRFDEIVNISKMCHGHILGAGAGPFFTHGKNCEMAANVTFKEGSIFANSTLHGVYNEEINTPEVIVATDNNFALLGQFLVTEGSSGQVIEVDVSGRLKEGSPCVFLREALTSAYGNLNEPVALGGVFSLTGSKGRFHVLPDFPDHPVDTPTKIGQFLKFFEINPPVIGLGTIVSHDPFGIDLKLEHFHCYNEKKNQAGHFYWDTEPENARYQFYLTVAEGILRIDHKKI